jgi:hypothetical protein
LKQLVATGATEMYDTLYDDKTEGDKWTGRVPLTYVTTRCVFVSDCLMSPQWVCSYKHSSRLGEASRRSFAFMASPAILIMVLIGGWIIVAVRAQPGVAFNPLHPASALAAGMNAEERPNSIKVNSQADEDELKDLPVILRFKWVTNDRMGIDTRATPPDAIRRQDGKTYSVVSLHERDSPHVELSSTYLVNARGRSPLTIYHWLSDYSETKTSRWSSFTI